MSQRPRTEKSRAARGTGPTPTPKATRYHSEIVDGKLVIRPMTDEEMAAYEALSPEEKARRFRVWADMPRPETPILPDEAFRRENLYD